MRTSAAIAATLIVCLLTTPASAHYLWVLIDGQPGEHGVANVYFEESAAPRDGGYLDHFTKTMKTWFRTVENIEPRVIATVDTKEDNKRRLRAELPASGSRGVDCYGKFGVYRYGNTDVLLHYYARTLDVHGHDDLHELADADHLRLRIVPHDEGDEVELRVLWEGKPASDRPVFIRGPAKFRKNLKTDKAGIVSLKIDKPGRYLFRTNIEEAKAGEDQGKSYSLIRHHGTLVMQLPVHE